MHDKLRKTLAFLFARNKESKAYYKTADGQFFSEQHRAEAHSNDLVDKRVEPFLRNTFEAFLKLQADKEAKEALEKAEADRQAKAEQADKEAKEALEKAEVERKAKDILEAKSSETITNAAELETAPVEKVQEEKPVKQTKAKTTKTTK